MDKKKCINQWSVPYIYIHLSIWYFHPINQLYEIWMKSTAPERPKKYTSLQSQVLYPEFSSLFAQPYEWTFKQCWHRDPFSMEILYKTQVPVCNYCYCGRIKLRFGVSKQNIHKKKRKKKNCRIEGFKRALMYCGFSSLSFGIIGPKMGIFFFFFSPSLVLGILEMGHMFYINIFIAVWFSGKNKQIELTSIHRAISPSPFSSFLFKEVLN